MTSDAANCSEHDDGVNQILADILAAEDAGNSPPPASVIEQYPQYAEELREFFAARLELTELLSPLMQVTSASSIARPPVLPSLPGRQFGEYLLLEEIARGGMGVVWRARDQRLNRTVALKMILHGGMASAEDRARFRAETVAAGSLDHPGIVPVYEVSESEGIPFYVMPLIEGVSLGHVLNSGPLNARNSATILKSVCDAIQYAHDRGIVHRDLKPANILLQDQRDPRVTDFGLARILTADDRLTRPGQVLGTPCYMAPEQARGDSEATGPAVDIWSLGAVLYQMLTGRPPFMADSTMETIRQVIESEAVPPRLLNSTVPRDLEAICLQCLSKQPELRYSSAAALATDLQRFLDGEHVAARSVNAWERLRTLIGQDRNDPHFAGWGKTLNAFGVVILLTHVVIFLLDHSRHLWLQTSSVSYLLPRCLMFGGLLVLLQRSGRYSVLPVNLVERLVWVVWLGFLASLASANGVRLVLGHAQPEIYPISALLTGLAFLVMGSHVWRGAFLIGLIWLLASPIMALVLPFASLLSGILWFASLLACGRHCSESRTPDISAVPGSKTSRT